MSPNVRSFILGTIGLLLIVVVGGIVILLGRAIFLYLASLNSNIAVAIIAGAATLFVTVVSIILGKLYEAQSLLQKEHREKKVPVYEELIGFMSRMLMSTKSGETISEKEMVEFALGFTQRMMVWGSDEVLAAWVKWRRLSLGLGEGKVSATEVLFCYEDLIFAIRRDLGHKNKGLVTGDVLALFVNDIDQFLPRKAT